MKVLLINPTPRIIHKNIIYRRFLPPLPPLGLAYIASVLEKNGISVAILDMYANKMNDKDVVRKIKDFKPNIVGFSVLTLAVNDVKRLVLQIREVDKNIKIVMGNTHASYFYKDLLNQRYADVIVHGEGELTMLSLCRSLEKYVNLKEVNGISYYANGEVIINSRNGAIDDLDQLPFPAFHLLDIKQYNNFPMAGIYDSQILTISASRGCPYQCYYCGQDVINKEPRYRKMAMVVKDMEYMYQRFKPRFFDFTDAYFPFSESTGLEFCDQLMGSGLHSKVKWFSQARVDKVNRKLLAKMKEAGVHLLAFGIEVGSQDMLDRMNKKSTLEQARQAFAYTKELGILTHGLFILGLPGDTVQACEATIRFAKELDCDIAKFNIAIPFPGSKFFEEFYHEDKECIEEPERFTPWYDWINISKDPLHVPVGMQGKELLGLQRKAMFTFYARPKVLLTFLKHKLVKPIILLFGAYILIDRYLRDALFRINIRCGILCTNIKTKR